MKPRSNIKSFTLVELLIVIAILAVLAAAVVIVLNPAELLAQARDSQRITDLKTLKDAIDIFVVDNPSASLGTSQKVYVSLPDTSSTCANISLPTLPAGWTYNCVTTANLRNTDGTGWVPLNLGSIFGGTPIPYLPLDPQNDATLTKYYAYIPGGSYVLTSLMESEKQAKQAAKDGGTDPGRFEVGSDLALWTESSGLQGYWEFNGTGAVSNGQTAGFEDISGNGNNGTAYNANGAGMTFVGGKEGNAVQCDGVDDWVSIPVTVSGTGATISFWAKNIGSSGYLLRSAANVRTYFQAASSSKISFTKGNPYVGITTTPSFGSDIWHHVSLSWRNDAGVLKASAYYDGYIIASDVVFTDTNQGTYISVCAFSLLGDSVAAGTIDKLTSYNRSLSANEIRSIYNADK